MKTITTALLKRSAVQDLREVCMEHGSKIDDRSFEEHLRNACYYQAFYIATQSGNRDELDTLREELKDCIAAPRVHGLLDTHPLEHLLDNIEKEIADLDNDNPKEIRRTTDLFGN